MIAENYLWRLVRHYYRVAVLLLVGFGIRVFHLWSYRPYVEQNSRRDITFVGVERRRDGERRLILRLCGRPHKKPVRSTKVKEAASSRSASDAGRRPGLRMGA